MAELTAEAEHYGNAGAIRDAVAAVQDRRLAVVRKGRMAGGGRRRNNRSRRSR
eukprot:SAG11_NODE_8069_length_1063_cov_1.304979_3_plen_52_part_01